MSNFPDQNQYTTPDGVEERNRRHLMALGLIEKQPMDTAPTSPTSDEDQEHPPSAKAPAPAAAWFGQLSPRAQSTVKSHPKESDSLLTWFSHVTAAREQTLEINVKGFKINVRVSDLKFSDDVLVVTIASDSGVSFTLEAAATLDLRWGPEAENKEWGTYTYFGKIDLGSPFPFFFMVFLKE